MQRPINRRAFLGAVGAGVLFATLPATSANAAGPKIYLDPGHGGSDTGATGNGLREKDLTLDIARRIRDHLNLDWGLTNVRMSRTGDQTRSLSFRSDDANQWGAAIFVSVHINAGGGTGFESYRYIGTAGETQRLHNSIHSNTLSDMRGGGSIRDRGTKTADFAVLRQTRMPAVLTENLFIDTQQDANLLGNPEFRYRAARGHARGIAAFFGLV